MVDLNKKIYFLRTGGVNKIDEVLNNNNKCPTETPGIAHIASDLK